MSKEHKCCGNVEEIKAEIKEEGLNITYEEALRRAGEKKETTLKQALEMHAVNIYHKRYYMDRLIGRKIVSSYVTEDGELKEYGTWINSSNDE